MSERDDNSAGEPDGREKSAGAFRTISEVSDELDVPQHVLRFWETKFAQVKPMKRAGGRRYYRPDDVVLLKRIRDLLYSEGFTIRGVQKVLRERGVRALVDEEGASAQTERAADRVAGEAAGDPTATSRPQAEATVDPEARAAASDPAAGQGGLGPGVRPRLEALRARLMALHDGLADEAADTP